MIRLLPLKLHVVVERHVLLGPLDGKRMRVMLRAMCTAHQLVFGGQRQMHTKVPVALCYVLCQLAPQLC